MGEENNRAEVQKLTQTRDRMRNVVGQMETGMEHLEVSSKSIGSTQDQYRIYDEKLASASAVLGHLKKKTEQDSKYIWWSFLFFISVVVYIVLKRLKVFKLMF